MKCYKVEKYEAFKVSGKTHYSAVANYGTMCEEDMLLTVKGYKANKMEDGTIIYTRSNSKYSYIVEEA